MCAGDIAYFVWTIDYSSVFPRSSSNSWNRPRPGLWGRQNTSLSLMNPYGGSRYYVVSRWVNDDYWLRSMIHRLMYGPYRFTFQLKYTGYSTVCRCGHSSSYFYYYQRKNLSQNNFESFWTEHIENWLIDKKPQTIFLYPIHLNSFTVRTSFFCKNRKI